MNKRLRHTLSAALLAAMTSLVPLQDADAFFGGGPGWGWGGPWYGYPGYGWGGYPGYGWGGYPGYGWGGYPYYGYGYGWGGYPGYGWGGWGYPYAAPVVVRPTAPAAPEKR